MLLEHLAECGSATTIIIMVTLAGQTRDGLCHLPPSPCAMNVPTISILFPEISTLANRVRIPL